MVWVTSREIKFNPNLNPNPKTDPNPSPKSKNNVCSTKRHQIIVQ